MSREAATQAGKQGPPSEARGDATGASRHNEADARPRTMHRRHKEAEGAPRSGDATGANRRCGRRVTVAWQERYKEAA